jgi:hypothetical protein
MSNAAELALKAISDRARFLLDTYAPEKLAEHERDVIKIDEQLAIVVAKLAGEYDKKRKPSLGGLLMSIKTWGS